ncbi:ribosomal protein S18-alanine N-acetyltransferase [Vagococcus xieshaowenii]|uniref:Ribosomal-protein-alanine N-acetyltransferase n=1 Tax=Vagococcus xieshaowenii TaxID=2562451 RepID=A0AAJ5EEU9_9ENTE|nr:ribosomal protein S18-alanine N-acetyltransferase [Vagococcus xieshaowenii]QCA28355.1 ribosomal-protein-alanine N-acetyltransferase [Vagococcus xieshaowenii]TFZ42257.1 ribosomal-protein-alanine N-acetyltransferase [Vagococcus xieshaowenii]
MWKKSELLQKVKDVIKKDPFMIQDTVAVLTQVSYREVRLDEIKSLQAIQKAVYQDRSSWSRYAFLAELNGNKPIKYIVADYRGTIIGFGGIRIEDSNAHITNLAVLPDYQGNGIGSNLLEQLLVFAENCEVQTLSLEVRTSNDKAQRLYKTIGFNVTKTEPNYYRDGEDAYFMRLDKRVQGE